MSNQETARAHYDREIPREPQEPFNPPTSTEDASIPEFGRTLAIDPFSLNGEAFQRLSPSGRDEVSKALMRVSSPESQTHLDALTNSQYEMQHPLSHAEKLTFGYMKNYMDKGISGVSNEQVRDAFEDNGVFDRLDMEKRRKNGDPKALPRNGNVLGFKWDRFDRYLLEEEINPTVKEKTLLEGEEVAIYESKPNPKSGSDFDKAA